MWMHILPLECSSWMHTPRMSHMDVFNTPQCSMLMHKIPLGMSHMNAYTCITPQLVIHELSHMGHIYCPQNVTHGCVYCPLVFCTLMHINLFFYLSRVVLHSLQSKASWKYTLSSSSTSAKLSAASWTLTKATRTSSQRDQCPPKHRDQDTNKIKPAFPPRNSSLGDGRRLRWMTSIGNRFAASL